MFAEEVTYLQIQETTHNFSSIGKEYRRINGIRPDYLDFNTRTIYELKPMNPSKKHYESGKTNGGFQLEEWSEMGC